MGFFRRRQTDNEIMGKIVLNKPVTSTEETNGTRKVPIGFPVVLADDIYFDREVVEHADLLRRASREQLMGNALLYLASAAVDEDAEYATIAMAYMKLAETLPNSPTTSE